MPNGPSTFTVRECSGIVQAAISSLTELEMNQPTSIFLEEKLANARLVPYLR
jgi:hypothetical protein